MIIPLLLAIAAGAGIVAMAERGADPVQEADRLARELRLGAGATVADVGAGGGKLALAMGRLFDGKMHLFASEVTAEKLEDLRSRLDKAGLANVTLVRSGARDPNLPGGCCDAIVMRRVYHHIEDRAAFAAGLYDAIRADGRLAIIDFPPSMWRFWMPRHGVAAADAERELAGAGFVKEKLIADWAWADYCLVFRRLPQRQGGSQP